MSQAEMVKTWFAFHGCQNAAAVTSDGFFPKASRVCSGRGSVISFTTARQTLVQDYVPPCTFLWNCWGRVLFYTEMNRDIFKHGWSFNKSCFCHLNGGQGSTPMILTILQNKNSPPGGFCSRAKLKHENTVKRYTEWRGKKQTLLSEWTGRWLLRFNTSPYWLDCLAAG